MCRSPEGASKKLDYPGTAGRDIFDIQHCSYGDALKLPLTVLWVLLRAATECRELHDRFDRDIVAETFYELMMKACESCHLPLFRNCRWDSGRPSQIPSLPTSKSKRHKYSTFGAEKCECRLLGYNRYSASRVICPVVIWRLLLFEHPSPCFMAGLGRLTIIAESYDQSWRTDQRSTSPSTRKRSVYPGPSRVG